MKYGKLISAMALLVALAIPVSLAGQEHQNKHQQYKLLLAQQGMYFTAQYPTCTLPCQRFDTALASGSA